MLDYIEAMWALAARGQLQGVWFWAAVYAFVLGAYSLVNQLRTRRWPWVQGELLAADVDRFGVTENVRSDQEYAAGAIYRYEVDGQRYEGRRVSPWRIVASHNARFVLAKQMSGIQRTAEGGVKVFYSPRKPRKSFLIVAGVPGLVITSLVCLLPAALFYLRFHA